MKKTFKNHDLLTLQLECADIIGQTDDSTLKFYMTALFEKASDLLKPFNKLKEELFKKYGTENSKGELQVKKYEVDIPEELSDEERAEMEKVLEPREEFIKFKAEHDKLIEIEIPVDYHPINISIFQGFKTAGNYPTVMKFTDLRV